MRALIRLLAVGASRGGGAVDVGGAGSRPVPHRAASRTRASDGRDRARSLSRPITPPATRWSPTTGRTTAVLIARHTYDTGGLGGVLNGSVVDHLASQGSLTYDWYHGLLFAVNAGQQHGVCLLRQGRPASTAPGRQLGRDLSCQRCCPRRPGLRAQRQRRRQRGRLRVVGDTLHSLAGSHRDARLDDPLRHHAVHPHSRTGGLLSRRPQLLVTTKANGNDIDVFGVAANGRLHPSSVVNSEPGTLPFAVIFDRAGHLVVAEAGTNALATFASTRTAPSRFIDAVGTGQAATCWVAPARGFLYASNAGSCLGEWLSRRL